MAALQDNYNLGVVGPGCSSSALPTAGFAPFLNQTMVSYGAEAHALSDHSVYKTFYRLSAAGRQIEGAAKAFVRSIHCQRFGVVMEVGVEFDQLVSNVKAVMMAEDRKLVLEQNVTKDNATTDIFSALQTFPENRVEVILVAAFAETARKVLCIAHNLVSDRVQEGS